MPAAGLPTVGPEGFCEGAKQLIFSTVKLRKSSLPWEAADGPVSSLCAHLPAQLSRLLNFHWLPCSKQQRLNVLLSANRFLLPKAL